MQPHAMYLEQHKHVHAELVRQADAGRLARVVRDASDASARRTRFVAALSRIRLRAVVRRPALRPRAL